MKEKFVPELIVIHCKTANLILYIYTTKLLQKDNFKMHLLKFSHLFI